MQLIAFALALAAQYSDPSLLPGERHSYAVRDFVQAADCDTKTCDLSPAFERLFGVADSAPSTVFGMRPPGSLIEIPPGEWRLSKPIVLNREHTLRGAGGAGWGAPTVLRVMTSTHGIIVNPGGAWAEISGLALLTAVASGEADRHGVVLKARAHVHDMWIRGFTVGVYALGYEVRPPRTGPPINVNGARLDNLRLDLQEYAGVYIAGDNAGAILLAGVDVGSGCKKGLKWASAFLGRACAGVMDYSMMGATIVGGQSAGARDDGGQYFGNYYLRRTSALGAYSENVPPPGQNFADIDSVVLGGTLGAPAMTQGTGFRLYGPRASQLRAYGAAAAGDTQRPEIWIGGDTQPPGTVLTLMPPQSGSAFPSYSALRTKLDTAPGKRGWRTDLQNAAQYTTQRVLVEPTKPGVVITRTSTKVIP